MLQLLVLVRFQVPLPAPPPLPDQAKVGTAGVKMAAANAFRSGCVNDEVIVTAPAGILLT